MCCVDQIAKLPISQVWILERFGWILAEARFDSEKICDAIATPVIAEPLGIVEDRREPERTHAKAFEVGQFVFDAFKTSALVRVAGECCWTGGARRIVEAIHE